MTLIFFPDQLSTLKNHKSDTKIFEIGQLQELPYNVIHVCDKGDFGLLVVDLASIVVDRSFQVQMKAYDPGIFF